MVLGTSGENQNLGVSLLIDSNETLMRTFVEIVPYPILGGGPEDRALEMCLEKNKERTGFLLFCFVLMKFSKPTSNWTTFCSVLVV